MVNLPTLRYTRLQKNKWLSCADIHSMYQLLKLTPKRLQSIQRNPKYTVFTIPKKNGTDRIIENPNDTLKELQKNINNYLQSVYYFIKHPASYGFCMNVKNDKYPCNIYTHALRHTGCVYLLNADLKDFFHTVTWHKLYDVFNDTPFIHDDESIQWLCSVTTCGNRLPMGAPTSPVLSNLAATKFDEAMEAVAKRRRCSYTRYADDMSFSSLEYYGVDLKEEILQTILEHGFIANREKIKEFGKKDTKIITGLQVGKSVSLGESYWQKTDMLLQQVTALKCLLQNRPSITVYNQVEEITKKINGFLAFAQMIGGSESDKIAQVQGKLYNMDENMEMFESLTWDDIPYQF